ncbi:MAG: FliM/FliN family flagellar motor switch protein [Candidatus Gastranaerophilales bacterium]|nr:FliM/FliN family flagellar motor switch protein [Candidatus Gastranaerophilales bacterium]
MQNKIENIFSNKNLNDFTLQYSEVVKSALESFWESDINVYMQAINDFREIRTEKLISNLDFFTSQIKVENHKPIITRLSKEFIENILEHTLENGLDSFKLNKITPLEIKILNSFCEFLYKKLKEILIPTNVAKLSEKSEKYINLVFLVLLNDICTKIMISIPQDRIDLKEIKKTQNFNDEDFLTSGAQVNLRAGSSKLTLEELQNLAKDDIVVLEESELSKMILLSGKIENKFNIKINPSLIINLENDEEGDENYIQTYEEVEMSKNLWDDIQIEINAEFEKVKMTIGELKQISQGQIVDLGSIFDNEISLFVEDRKVAKGELIIINDRYAVRLNEVLNNAKTTTPIAQAKPQQPQQAQPQKPNPGVTPAQKPQPSAQKPQPSTQNPQTAVKQGVPNKPQAQPQARPRVVEDEDFDYSDFEK